MANSMYPDAHCIPHVKVVLVRRRNTIPHIVKKINLNSKDCMGYT